ncbi:hypothetical protein NZK35_09020 [Stieleria sp. ICT_E10.1]|uniref:hypothetical protein n=1 Tax=Stieleria sedimenti TaxID=2976331 RepID=UPI00217FA9C7|nr:hypothetical protein [Stieleria sedimenti]MCS7466782.1 hypothetical protein [Stieleria sedimenti]
MTLWSAKRWGARIRKKGEETWIDLNRPFALVGSDPRCDVQIGDSKLPGVVYLVVACGDRIEVWPTCPLAFPIWGRVSKNHVLMVGKSRIQFYFKDDGDETEFTHHIADDDDSADITQDVAGSTRPAENRRSAGKDGSAEVSADVLPTATLILDWGSGPRHKSLNRNVSILGEDHPSLIRLHHADLERCDHGVVCFGDDVWLIELHPDRLGKSDSLIRQIRPGDKSVLVGGIHLWVEGSEPLDVKKLVKSRKKVGRERSVPQPAPSRGEVSTAVVPAAPTTSSEAVRPSSAATIASRRVAVVESTSHDEAESITMELTDRLLETNARKSFRRRLLKISAISGLVTLAVAVVLAILIWGVLPMVRAIYGP